MAFCSSCGSQVEGRFCAKCGTPVAAAGAGAVPPPPPPQYQQAVGAQSAGLEENVACALCYSLMLLSGILFLVIAPYNQNRLIRFHAWQAIFTWIALAVISVGVSIVGHVPFIGWIALFALWPVMMVGGFVLWLLLMYKAYNRERWVLPFIGPLAEKQA